MLKHLKIMDVYGFTVITAITSQNTKKISEITNSIKKHQISIRINSYQIFKLMQLKLGWCMIHQLSRL